MILQNAPRVKPERLLAAPWNLIPGNWNLALDPRLCLSMYFSLFVRKYRQKYRRLRTRLHRQLHRSLYLDLNLDLDLDLNPSLFGALLKQLFETLLLQLFVTLFGSLFNLKYGWLQVSSRLTLCRQMLPPRQPVGRPLLGPQAASPVASADTARDKTKPTTNLTST